MDEFEEFINGYREEEDLRYGFNRMNDSNSTRNSSEDFMSLAQFGILDSFDRHRADSSTSGLGYSKAKPHSGNTLKAKKQELSEVKKFGATFKRSTKNKETWNSGKEFRSSSSDEDEQDDDDDDDGGDDNFQNKPTTSNNTRRSKPREFVRRLQWRDEDMHNAMQCVKEGRMTMRGAAKTYRVPYSTLKDRIKERVIHGTKPGVKTMLNSQEEQKLVRVIKYLESSGYNVNCKDVRLKAQELLAMSHDRQSQMSLPGHNWLSGFVKRHPDCKFNKSNSRIFPPKEMKNKIFEISLKIQRKMAANDKSNRIHCMSIIKSAYLPNTDIIVAASAGGVFLSPYVFGNFDKSILSFMQQIYPSAVFASGYGNRQEHVARWFDEIFLTAVKPTFNNIGALYLNLTKSDISMKFAESSIENKTHLVYIPDELKDLHPFDTALINAIKNQIEKNQGSGNVGYSERKEMRMARELKKLFENNDLFQKEIRDRFKVTGLHPLKLQSLDLRGNTEDMSYFYEGSSFKGSLNPTRNASSNYANVYGGGPEVDSRRMGGKRPRQYEGGAIDEGRASKVSRFYEGDGAYDAIQNGMSLRSDDINISIFHNDDVVSQALASISAENDRFLTDYSTTGGALDDDIVKLYELEASGIEEVVECTEKFEPLDQEIDTIEEIITDVNDSYHELNSSDLRIVPKEEVVEEEVFDEFIPIYETVSSAPVCEDRQHSDLHVEQSEDRADSMSRMQPPLDDEMIKLGEMSLRASQKVQMTLKKMCNNHPVEVIKKATLKEAMDIAGRNLNVISLEITII